MSGGPRWTVNRLSSEIGLPGIAIAQIGSTLEKAGLLIATEDDEFVPGRDVSRITLQEILQRREGISAAGIRRRGECRFPSVDRLSESLEKALARLRAPDGP